MKKLINKIWVKIKQWCINTWHELKDWRTLILHLIVCTIISATVWVPYLIALITGNNCWWGIGTAIWIWWLGPCPFTLITVTITITIKKIWVKIKQHKTSTSDKDEITKSE